MTLAPCGVVCDLCIAFQRPKNTCAGCNNSGYKPKHCNQCSIKLCSEKSDDKQLCIECSHFPCRRLKDLEKRYINKYGESLFENMRIAKEHSLEGLTGRVIENWTCSSCGSLLSAHRGACIVCGTMNPRFPDYPV